MRALTYSMAAAVAIGAGLLVGSGAVGTRDRAEQKGALVRITEQDFKITAPRTAPAGDVRLSIVNKGPVQHELLVVRVPRTGLPMRADGLTVDEDAVARATAVMVDGLAPGTVRELAVRLTPGRYVLLCNMSGHYRGGMRADLAVQ